MADWWDRLEPVGSRENDPDDWWKGLEAVEIPSAPVRSPGERAGYGEAIGAELENVPARFQQQALGVEQMFREDPSLGERGVDVARDFGPQSISGPRANPQFRDIYADFLRSDGVEVPEDERGRMTTLFQQARGMDDAQRGRFREFIAGRGAEGEQRNQGRIAEIQQRYRELSEGMTPNPAERGTREWYVSQAVGSLVGMGPAVIGTIATANPLVGMGIITGQVSGDSYASGREQGLDPETAREYAGLQAAAEAIPSAIPLGNLVRPGSGVLKDALKQAGLEGFQETITAALQSAIDFGYVEPDMTFGDAMANIRDGAIIGAITGGGVSVAAAPFRPSASEATQEPQEAPAEPAPPEIPTLAPAPLEIQPTAPSGPLADAALLRGAGFTPDDILTMNPEERAAEIAEAREAGVPLAPLDQTQAEIDEAQDRLRLDSPYLTDADRASPIPNRIIDDGKAALDRFVNQANAPRPAQPPRPITDLDRPREGFAPPPAPPVAQQPAFPDQPATPLESRLPAITERSPNAQTDQVEPAGPDALPARAGESALNDPLDTQGVDRPSTAEGARDDANRGGSLDRPAAGVEAPARSSTEGVTDVQRPREPDADTPSAEAPVAPQVPRAPPGRGDVAPDMVGPMSADLDRSPDQPDGGGSLSGAPRDGAGAFDRVSQDVVSQPRSGGPQPRIEDLTDQSLIVRGIDREDGKALLSGIKPTPIWNAREGGYRIAKGARAEVEQRLSSASDQVENLNVPEPADASTPAPEAAPTEAVDQPRGAEAPRPARPQPVADQVGEGGTPAATPAVSTDGPGRGVEATPEPTAPDITAIAAEERGTETEAPVRREVTEAEYEPLRKELDRLGGQEVDLLIDNDPKTGGRYIRDDDGARIIIGASLDPKRTVNHEFVHFARDKKLYRNNEWQVLTRRAKGLWMKRYNIAERYKDKSPEVQLEEAIAAAQAEFSAGKMRNAPSPVARAFRRVQRFLEATGNWLRGLGYQSADDVMARVQSGEVGGRPRSEQAASGDVIREQAVPPRRTRGIPASTGKPWAALANSQDIKAHKDYDAAKAGDIKAAIRLVEDIVPRAKLVSAAMRFGPDTVFVPALAEEAKGRNKIPIALAYQLAAVTGGSVNDGIIQKNKAFHTGARPMERLIARPEFDGGAEAGAQHVLVDDVTNLGGTLAELGNLIQAEGGQVKGVAVLANDARGGNIVPSRSRVRILERRFGDEIRELFSVEPAALTAAEADYLANFRDADQLRESVAKARDERSRRLGEDALREDQTDQSEDDSDRLEREERLDTSEPPRRPQDSQDALDFTGFMTLGADTGEFGSVKRAVREMQTGARGASKVIRDAQLEAERLIVNAFVPLRELELRVREARGQGRTLAAGMESALKTAEITVNEAGRNEVMLYHGAGSVNDFGAFGPASGTMGIRQMLDKLGTPERIANWAKFLIARRAKALRERGIKSPVPTKKMFEGLRLAEQDPLLEEVAADWKQFNDANLDLLVDTGRLTRELADTLKADDSYVPFFRSTERVDGEENIFESFGVPKPGLAGKTGGAGGGNLVNTDPGIMKIKGGETLAINNVIENMIHQSQRQARAAMRNLTVNRTLDLLEETGWTKLVPAKDSDKKPTSNAVRVWREGKQMWLVPQSAEAEGVVMALAGLEPVRLQGFSKWMATIASVFRQGITLSPAFILRNGIRGIVATGVLTGGANLRLTKNVFTGAADSLRRGPGRQQFSGASGMGSFTFGETEVGLGQNDIMIEYGIQPKTFGYRIRRVVNALEEFGTATELGDRISAMRRLEESGTRADEAAYQALAIVNYGRRGASATLRHMLPMIPFLNARIQGLARLGSGAVGRGANAQTRRQALFRLAVYGSILTTASAALWALNNFDDEDRERYEAEPLHRRLNYHIFYGSGGEKYLIPKAFEIGAVFGTSVEMLLDAAVKGDTSESREALVSTLMNTFSFNPIPAAALPAIEAAANYDFFTGREIEGPRFDGLLPEDRIDRRTGAIAQLAGHLGVSPVMAQHLLEGYGGAPFFALSAVTDAAASELGLVPEKPEQGFGDVPVVTPALQKALGSMYRNADPDPSNRFIGEFYEWRREITQYVRSAKQARQAGDVERFNDLISEAPGGSRVQGLYKMVNKAGRHIGELNTKIRRIEASNIDAAAKRERLNPLIERRNRIATAAVQRIDRIVEATE
ncbi:MAG: LPD38 domain-containing protein [Pseudomonadota bacterium]